MNEENFKHLTPYIRVARNDHQTTSFKFERSLWDYEIIYLEEGTMRLTINNKVYECVPGDIILLRPRTPHILESNCTTEVIQPHIHFDFFKDEYSEKIYVSFVKENKMNKEQKKWFRNDFLKELQLDLPPVMHFNNPYVIRDILYKIIDEFTLQHPFSDYFLHAYFIELFAEILRNYHNKNNEINSKHLNELSNLIKYIHENIDLDLSLDDLVREIKLSKFYFSRLFKNVYNMAPHKYISIARLKRAKELIQFTDLQIQEISNKMNFESPQAFTRWFKNLDGKSPNYYRNKKM